MSCGSKTKGVVVGDFGKKSRFVKVAASHSVNVSRMSDWSWWLWANHSDLVLENKNEMESWARM